MIQILQEPVTPKSAPANGADLSDREVIEKRISVLQQQLTRVGAISLVQKLNIEQEIKQCHELMAWLNEHGIDDFPRPEPPEEAPKEPEVKIQPPAPDPSPYPEPEPQLEPEFEPDPDYLPEPKRPTVWESGEVLLDETGIENHESERPNVEPQVAPALKPDEIFMALEEGLQKANQLTEPFSEALAAGLDRIQLPDAPVVFPEPELSQNAPTADTAEKCFDQGILNEEICNEEIYNEEICNEEICNEEICNEEICNEEILNEEILELPAIPSIEVPAELALDKELADIDTDVQDLEESNTEAVLVEQAESPQAEALATELLLEQFPLQEGELAEADTDVDFTASLSADEFLPTFLSTEIQLNIFGEPL